MSYGPGKYDAEATALRRQTKADGVVIVILNGNRGSGCSVQLPQPGGRDLARVLRQLADEFDKDVTS